MDLQTHERLNEVRAAVRRLDQLVTHLYSHLGLPMPEPEPVDTGVVSPEVRALIDAGNKLQAVRLHRELTGAGLNEAKDAVEQYEKR